MVSYQQHIKTKRDNVREQLAVYSDEKSRIKTAVAELRAGLSNNKIQYKDRETGQIITTTSSSTRRSLEKQLDQAILRQTEINTKVDGLNERLFEYETEIVEVSINNDIAGELGPLKYLSGLTGTPMDKIINYLLLTIIFVFDPLAIALVIAANYSFELLKGKTKENIYGENIIDEVQEELPSKQTLEELHTLTESHKELLKTLEIINSPSHSDILRKLNKLDKMIDLEEEVKPDNIKEDDGLVLVERPHRIYGTHTMVVSKDNIPKGYSPKKKDEDLTITY